MADQMQPPENRRDSDQTFNMSNQAGQNISIDQYPGQGRRFVAPAESFGSFGPLPGYPATIPSGELQISPAPFAAADTPATGAGNPYAPTLSATSPAPFTPGNTYASALPEANALPFTPGNFYTPAPFIANPYSGSPMPGNPSTVGMPGTMPYVPYGMYAPFSPPARTKKPILFPLTRKASALLQIFGMLLYSLIMALGIMGCILTMLRAYVTNASVYVNLDGSVNGLSILVTIVLILLLIPASSLFSGAFFGSWRGTIVAILSLSGGVLLAHVSDTRFGNPQAALSNYLPFVAPIIAALAVGLVYDRRKYAAWWKSMLTMFLGTAILLIWFLVSIYALDANASNLSILAANSHMTLQNYLESMAIGMGCIALFTIPLLGLLFAGLEGLIHSVLARIK